MRALQICSYYASPLYRLLFDELDKNGIEQEVFYFAVRGTGFDSEKGVMFSDCYGRADRLFFMRKEEKVLRELYRSFDVGSFDLAHAHSLYANGYVALDLKRKHGIPYIVAVRNSDVSAFLKVRPWLRDLGVRIMLEAERVVFISPAYRSLVLERYVPEQLQAEIAEKSDVIPNGISRMFLEHPPIEQPVGDGTIRVIQVGDIDKNKNQLSVARACARLVDRGYRVNFRVVGKRKKASVARRLSRYSFVELFDPVSQEDLKRMYRESDVFAMPSLTETFGLVYAEAMSQGLPVIYSCKQGFDGWFEDGEVGYAVDSCDVEGIATRIVDCIREQRRFREENPLKAQRFDWDPIGRMYFEMYSKVAGRCSDVARMGR